MNSMQEKDVSLTNKELAILLEAMRVTAFRGEISGDVFALISKLNQAQQALTDGERND